MTEDVFFCDNTKKSPVGGDKNKGRGGKKTNLEEKRGAAGLSWSEGEKHVFVGKASPHKTLFKKKPRI